MRILILVLVVACQHSTPAETLITGTRLRALTLSAPGGIAIDYAFYDSGLGVPCGFLDIGGGTVVCAPSAVATSKLFSDSACTQPVTMGATRDGYGVPYAFAVTTSDGAACTAPVATYFHATPISATQLYDATKGCTPLVVTGERPPVTYAIGAAVTPAELVTGSKVTTKIDSRFSAKGFAGSDGSRQHTSSWQEPTLIDNQLSQTQCALALAIDETIRCMPSPTYDQVDVNTFFSDQNCDNFATLSCAATAYDFTWDGQCGPFDSAHAIPSQTLALTSVYSAVGAHRQCQAGTLPSGTFPYVLGQASNPTTFAQFKTTSEGTGRLRVHRSNDGAGVDLVQGLYDSQTAHECFLAPSGDGAGMVCIPNTHFGLYFSDAACTAPIAVSQPGACYDPGGVPDPADTSPSDPTMVANYQWDSVSAFTVGPVIAAPPIVYGQYLTIPANALRVVVCAQASLVANSEFHSLSAKSLSDFPSASIVIPTHK